MYDQAQMCKTTWDKKRNLVLKENHESVNLEVDKLQSMRCEMVPVNNEHCNKKKYSK